MVFAQLILPHVYVYYHRHFIQQRAARVHSLLTAILRFKEMHEIVMPISPHHHFFDICALQVDTEVYISTSILKVSNQIHRLQCNIRHRTTKKHKNTASPIHWFTSYYCGRRRRNVKYFYHFNMTVRFSRTEERTTHSCTGLESTRNGFSSQEFSTTLNVEIAIGNSFKPSELEANSVRWVRFHWHTIRAPNCLSIESVKIVFFFDFIFIRFIFFVLCLLVGAQAARRELIELIAFHNERIRTLKMWNVFCVRRSHAQRRLYTEFGVRCARKNGIDSIYTSSSSIRPTKKKCSISSVCLRGPRGKNSFHAIRTRQTAWKKIHRKQLQ